MFLEIPKRHIKVMKKQKIKFYLSHQVNKVERNGETVTVTALDKKEEDLELAGVYCLFAVGRYDVACIADYEQIARGGLSNQIWVDA